MQLRSGFRGRIGSAHEGAQARATCSPYVRLYWDRMSMPSGYVELHARSAFSFLRGACTPEDYSVQCKTLDQPGMALLDWDGFYGSPRFHHSMMKASLVPYVGAEVG